MPLELVCLATNSPVKGVIGELPSTLHAALSTLTVALPGGVKQVTSDAIHLSAFVPDIVSEAVVGPNAKPPSDFTRRVSAVTRSVIRPAAFGRLIRHRCM